MSIEKQLNTSVIFQDTWDNNLDKEYEKKLEVDGIVYKYRLYYKTLWNETKNPNILSFVMLNPSTANQYSNDPSVNNCIKIAKKCDYDGIEVVNIYSLRHPVFDKIKNILKTEGNPPDINYDFAQLKKVVLAWGNKKISKDTNPKLFSAIEKAEKLYILGVEDESKIKSSYKYKSSQIRHPDNRAWVNLGSFGNAKLQEIENKKLVQYLKN